jgi:hypothetical protein
MRLEATRANQLRGQWIDLATGRQIRWVKWGDEETGEYAAFRMDPVIAEWNGIPPEAILYRGRTRLRFIARPVLMKPFPGAASRAEVRTHSPDPARRGLLTPCDPDAECEQPKCHRKAAWWTADEEELEPVAMGERLFQRATTIRRHFWCSWHYRWPVIKSQRGVEREAMEVTARPQ